MITTGIIIGMLWFAAALIFTLGLARSASRRMPDPLSDIGYTMSVRKSKWNLDGGGFECLRHRHDARNVMATVTSRRFDQRHIASIRVPRRTRRSRSAEN